LILGGVGEERVSVDHFQELDHTRIFPPWKTIYPNFEKEKVAYLQPVWFDEVMAFNQNGGASKVYHQHLQLRQGGRTRVISEGLVMTVPGAALGTSWIPMQSISLIRRQQGYASNVLHRYY